MVAVMSRASVASAHSGILNAGSYTGNYTAYGAVDNNYSFTYISGNLTVEPANLQEDMAFVINDLPTSVQFLSQSPVGIKIDLTNSRTSILQYAIGRDTSSVNPQISNTNDLTISDEEEQDGIIAAKNHIERSNNSTVIEISPDLAKILNMTMSRPLGLVQL